MLAKTKITGIEMLHKNAYKLWEYNEAWLDARRALFTSSEIWKLCGPKGLGDTGRGYIEEKVLEHLSGKRIDSNLDTDAIRHGLMYEPDAIQKYMSQNGISEGLVRVRTFIHELGSMFGCTPDWIHILSESADQKSWLVRGGQAKCPPKNFVSLALCNTAMDLKEESRSYYLQCLDEMQNLGAIEHDFITFHPDVHSERIPHIRIKANESVRIDNKNCYPISEDLKFLNVRKEAAVTEFWRIVNDLKAKGYA